MPRRSLRKIDPALDLSRHLRTVEDLPVPWSNAAIFGRESPLEVEIGSGKGLFLSSAASAAPEHDFLGIELAGKYARFAAARLAKAGLNNACVVEADGLRIFRERLPECSLAAVHVYFPDPWWKARHKKRRVMTAVFLGDVERTLIAGGRLHFWTDVHEYFEATLDLVRQTTQLSGPFEVPERPPEHDLDYRTHFERRMRLTGEPVYRAEFEKSSAFRIQGSSVAPSAS
jgi:tRNA (guanine-N7-)-methyltransferase